MRKTNYNEVKKKEKKKRKAYYNYVWRIFSLPFFQLNFKKFAFWAVMQFLVSMPGVWFRAVQIQSKHFHIIEVCCGNSKLLSMYFLWILCTCTSFRSPNDPFGKIYHLPYQAVVFLCWIFTSDMVFSTRRRNNHFVSVGVPGVRFFWFFDFQR